MNSFLCVQCGLCCQSLNDVPLLDQFNLGNGICRFYHTDDCSCEIYKDRPIICNVDLFYEKHLKEKIDRGHFYQLNYQHCLSLMQKHGAFNKYNEMTEIYELLQSNRSNESS